jgi:hypothetical protein
MHVAKERIVQDYGPVYIGQVFEQPATVLAQTVGAPSKF